VWGSLIILLLTFVLLPRYYLVTHTLQQKLSSVLNKHNIIQDITKKCCESVYIMWIGNKTKVNSNIINEPHTCVNVTYRYIGTDFSKTDSLDTHLFLQVCLLVDQLNLLLQWSKILLFAPLRNPPGIVKRPFSEGQTNHVSMRSEEHTSALKSVYGWSCMQNNAKLSKFVLDTVVRNVVQFNIS
jgi:hypothetical protein